MKKLCLIIIMVLFLFAYSNTYGLTTLHESSTRQVINSGTNLTKYKRLTDKGWLAINVIEIDMNDENTSIKPITSSSGLSTFETVKTMLTNEKNCIAAINADFFNGNSKKGNIIGMTIKDGKMLTSTYYENEIKDTLASFYIDSNNGAAFDYFTNKISLRNLSNNGVLPIAEINKWSSNYEYPVLYTSEWGTSSLGNTPGYGMTELVVDNNIVKEVRVGLEPCEIPENGFVITTIGNSAELINSYFKKGDRVILDIDMKIIIEKVKTAISGGAMLVKEGKVADFSHMIYGTNPRTAIGLSKDCSKVYLITIDGRKTTSVGVTQEELAQIIVDLGIYTAMNFDGGGSTTMVVRELGDVDPTVENTPSDGGLRMVPNAVGVFNTDKTGDLNSLLIEVSDEKVFVNGKKGIVVKGYDEYYNPVSIDMENVNWDVSGVEGKVEDCMFVAGDEPGKVTITAKYKGATGTIKLDVLSAPNELTISPKRISAQKGESVKFSVIGQNKDGYATSINNDEVEWNTEGNATIKNGEFSAREDGSYLVSVSCGNAKAYATVEVQTNICKVLNDFEDLSFYFKNYPEEVLGNVSLYKKKKYDGSSSAKLEYDFTKTNVTRAAYLRFNEGIGLGETAKKIKVKALVEEEFNDKIKAKITDNNGEIQYANFISGIDTNGWQELILDLKEISLPAMLTDLYVVQENATKLTSGYVLFDDLEVEYAPKNVIEAIDIPEDIKGEDELAIPSDLESNSAFRVVVSPELYNGVLLERLKNKTIENIINKNSEIVIYPYRNGEKMLTNISKTKAMGDAYSISNKGILSIVTINISNGGIRITDSNQWISLQNDIKNANKNVLVVLNGSRDSFKDSMEKELFESVLSEISRTTGKNIWVVEQGNNTGYAMNCGVRYLSIASEKCSDNSTVDNIKNMKYFIITVNEDKMTYEIKGVFEK